MRIGFIGTGTIAGAMVEGLQHIASPHAITLSPRSTATTTALVARHPAIRRAASNAEVAAEADMVVLGIRPAQVEEALAGIVFRPGQIVLSLVAGLPLVELQALAPSSRVDRLVPLPGIARGEGPMTEYPGLPEVRDIFGPLGDLLVTRDETELYMGGVNAFMSSYFELQKSLIALAERSGASPENARAYVVSMLAMLSGTARHATPEEFASLVPEHQTKGGLNERIRQHLLDNGWFGKPAEAAEIVMKLGRKSLD